MPNYRKVVRDAARAALADEVAGFFATLQGLSAGYGVSEDVLAQFQIDFNPGSNNFFQGFLSPGDVGFSELAEVPGLVLYTSAARNEGREKSRQFAGAVLLHIDAYLKFHDGVERDDTEAVADAVEDALVSVVNAIHWPAGVSYNREYSVDRGSLQLLSDGWWQRVPLTAACGVYI